MFEQLLTLVSQYPKTFFYLGIGSCPHVGKPEDLTLKNDQLLPPFVRDRLQKEGERIQIVHIDPVFRDHWGFLRQYFAYNLPGSIYSTDDGTIQIWDTDRVQVICASTRYHHPNPPHSDEDDTWFLESLTDEALASGYQMVYQEYTGYYTRSLFKKLYSTCDDSLKRRFQNQILFDVSYGYDVGCSTDMEKHKPIYQSDGTFLNILLCSNEELFEKLDQHPTIRKIMIKNLILDYRDVLNTIHVDYRRTMNGDMVFHPGIYGYDDTSSPDEIMMILQAHLKKTLPLLVKTGIFSQDDLRKLETYFQEYRSMDKYKWYEKVSSLVKFEMIEPANHS